jgi:hypothetical protein
LGPEVSQSKFVQGDQICCCFCQVAAALTYCFNSVLSELPLKRWDNSILSTALSAWTLAQGSTMALVWEVSLLLHSHSQPLCFAPPLLSATLATGRFACHPTPALSLCYLSCLHLLRVLGPCTTALLQGRFSIPPPTLVSVLDCNYNCLLMILSVLPGWSVSLLRECPGLCSLGVDRGVALMCVEPVGSTGLCRQF